MCQLLPGCVIPIELLVIGRIKLSIGIILTISIAMQCGTIEKKISVLRCIGIKDSFGSWVYFWQMELTTVQIINRLWNKRSNIMKLIFSQNTLVFFTSGLNFCRPIL